MTQLEQTLVLLKPDCVQRGLIGESIKRLEQRGLKIIAMKMVKPSIEHITNHYPSDEKWVERLGEKGFKTFEEVGLDPIQAMGTNDKKKAGEMVRKWLVEYMTEAPIVAMIVEGVHAIETVRKIAGPTKPYEAPIGTIRGDFSTDSPAAANVEKRSIKNLIHASETKEEAAHEIAHWFSQEEVYSWELVHHKAMY